MTPREFLSLHWSAPQIEVIDRAIDLITSGQRFFCCFALGAAVAEAGGLNSKSFAVARLYKSQFERFCASRNGGHLPKWWNGKSAGANARRRIAALRAFRKACITAAKDQS